METLRNEQFCALAQAGEQALSRLIESNLPFIQQTANQLAENPLRKELLASCSIDADDLIQAGSEEIAPLYTGMRNCTWSKRKLMDTIVYLVDLGCKWRQLPHDFPLYSTVHSFYRRARISGLWDKILEHLVKKTQMNRSHMY